MKPYKHLAIIFVTFILLTTPLAATPANPVQDTALPATETYTRAHVDSLINEAFSNNLNTLVRMKVYEQYGAFSSDQARDQSKHDSTVAWILTLIGVLITAVVAIVTISINRGYERLIGKRLDENKHQTAEKLEENKLQIDRMISDQNNVWHKYQEEIEDMRDRLIDLIDSAEQSARYAEFSVELTKALTSKDISVRLSLLSELFRDYKDDEFVAVVHNCRGNIYLDKYEENGTDVFIIKAIRDYRSAIDKNPNLASPYNNLGYAFFLQESYGKAIENYDNAIKLNPDYAVAYNNRGAAYRRIEENKKAVEDCSIAIDLYPEYSKAYHNRSEAYNELATKAKKVGDQEKAKKYSKLARSDAKKAKELGYNV